jgi:molybdopterin converting factor small subunit
VTESIASDERAETSGSAPCVQIRYWAAARAAAGVAEDSVEASTVAEALEAARDRHRDQPQFDKVLSVCSFLLDETPLGTRDLSRVSVGDGDLIDVLPPFAGG